MTRFALLFLTLMFFLSAILFTGSLPAESHASTITPAPIFDAAYRSNTAFHKVMVKASDAKTRDAILARGGSVIADYGAFALLKAPSEATELLTAESNSAIVRDDMNAILLRAGAFDTTQGEAQALRLQETAEADEVQLYLVQLVGPAKQEWMDVLEASAEIVAYVPNNAYLIRADASGFAQLKSLVNTPASFLQWSGDFKPAYKIAPEIALNSETEISATVQLVNSKRLEKQVKKLAQIPSLLIEQQTASAAGFINVRVKVRQSQVAGIARLSDVVWIEPYEKPVLFDERQGQILAGNFTSNSELPGPGYLAWLRVKGLASTPDFLVDIADSGIDRGVLDPAVVHKDFLNQAGLNRIIYAKLFSFSGIEGTSQDSTGHGTLNASIVGGYNTGNSFPFVDGNGFSYGLGIHPFVRLGISKIFNPEFTSPDVVVMTDAMYRNGARISSNSWGIYNNTYTADCQTYDAMVRDAQRNDSGNQELTIVFASGNQGPNGSLASPGTAKNVITVGASENLRPGLDGCGVPTEGADNTQDMIDFSSGGKTADGRTKPEIAAPGTHIQGAISQDRGFTGSGVCGRFPGGQTLYTWSSGTSHACPAVAGGAALVRQFFQNSTGRAPSPAMTKAFLANTASYMTGQNANDNLPGSNQGFGRMNLGRAFDEASKLLIDQTQILAETGRSFTLKGRVVNTGKPFRVALAWTDAPGTPAASPVVNDINLEVSIGGQTYLGNRFNGSVSTPGGAADRLNNVEAVWLPEGVSGEFEVRVIAANIAGDGIPGNSDSTDQDFALVVYNGQPVQLNGDGTVDAPPIVTLKFPVGGESLTPGNLVRITWDASDDKAIQSQRVEFSSDNGTNYNVIATLDGNVRFFDWRVPAIATTQGRIKVSALDGVNLASSSVNTTAFSIVIGPPDTTAPVLEILSPTGDATLGGGTTTTIKWRESDNVGVIRRLLELSTDRGETFQEITTIIAPSSGAERSFDWEIPVALSTDTGRIRISLFDGANNRTTLLSPGKFTIWALPIITDVSFVAREDGRNELEVYGRKFRQGDTDIIVDGIKLKKTKFQEKCDDPDGSCKKISNFDKKLLKRLPEGNFVDIQVRIPSTGQISPTFAFKRKRPKP